MQDHEVRRDRSDERVNRTIGGEAPDPKSRRVHDPEAPLQGTKTSKLHIIKEALRVAIMAATLAKLLEEVIKHLP
jgi:hypothetical protein